VRNIFLKRTPETAHRATCSVRRWDCERYGDFSPTIVTWSGLADSARYRLYSTVTHRVERKMPAAIF
jgi:hypothetical protein